jgi:hypothetical protein
MMAWVNETPEKIGEGEHCACCNLTMKAEMSLMGDFWLWPLS